MPRIIAPVKNNTDKQNTYCASISRYNKAMKEGFYLEALMIDYAIMEDRLRSFLYHIGLLNTRSSTKMNGKKAKASLKDIVKEYKEKDENDYFVLSTISGKMKIIRCTLKWAEQEDYDRTDKYLTALRRQYDRYMSMLAGC